MDGVEVESVLEGGRMKFRKEEIPNPIFHYDVIVVIADDFEEAAKKLKLAIMPVETFTQNEALHFAVTNEPKSFLFFHPKADHGTIAHEVWHAVRRLHEYIGAEFENEVVAYLLGYYVRHVEDIVRRKK